MSYTGSSALNGVENLRRSVNIMMKELCRLMGLFLAALAVGVAFSPVSAQSNSDWYRRQQQQQQQQQQQRQQQQEQQRQQQQQQQRQQMQQQMRQQQQQQMREQMQQQQRQQMQQQMRQQQQRRQISEASPRGSVQRRDSRATCCPSIVSKRSDRIVYSNGITKLTRPLTPRDIGRGFTGKVTQDGRALVKIKGRVFAVPAARAAIKANRSQSISATRASRWNESKRAAISADVKNIAAARLKNKARAGGDGGGRKPPGGGGGDNKGQPPKPPIPDEVPRNLQEQTILKDAQNLEQQGLNKFILGGRRKPLVDASRLVSHYGGKPGEWVKMTGPSYTNNSTQEKIQVHYFKNTRTKQAVEWKFDRKLMSKPKQ